MFVSFLLCLSSKFGLIVVDEHHFKNDAHSIGFLMRSHSIRSDHILTLTFSDVVHPSKLASSRARAWFQLLQQNSTEKNLLVFVSDGDSESAKGTAFRSKFVKFLRNITRMPIAPNMFFIAETRNPSTWTDVDLKNCLSLIVVKNAFESESCDPFVRDFFAIGNRFPRQRIRKIVTFLSKRETDYTIDQRGNEAVLGMRLAEFVGERSRELTHEFEKAFGQKKKQGKGRKPPPPPKKK